MQKEPTVFAVAIGCEQLLLHNMRVSSVYIAGGFHMSPHSTVPFTLKVLIHGLKKKQTNTKERKQENDLFVFLAVCSGSLCWLSHANYTAGVLYCRKR